jgi:hypothetical protein
MEHPGIFIGAEPVLGDDFRSDCGHGARLAGYAIPCQPPRARRVKAL